MEYLVCFCVCLVFVLSVPVQVIAW